MGAQTLLNEIVSCPLLSRPTAAHEEHQDELRLERLIHLSRSPPQRRLLAALDAVPRLLPLLSPNKTPRALCLHLKLLRNLCAGEASNQQAFLHGHGVKSVALLFDNTLELLPQKRPELIAVLHASLQLLGNACGGGEAQKAAVWRSFFPTRFRALVPIWGENKIMEPLCMVLYTCSHGVRHRLTDLCRDEGAVLLSDCLTAAASHGVLCSGASDWIYLLVSDLCLREPLLPLVFASLRDPSEFSTSKECTHLPEESLFSAEQVTLLSFLLDLLADKVLAHSDLFQREQIGLPMPSESIEFLVETIRVASTLTISRAYPETSIAGTPYATRPCGVPAIDVLGYALEIAKVLSGWECEEQSNAGGHYRSSIVAELLSHGLIRLCIQLLEDLGPPELIFRAIKKHDNANLTDERGFQAYNGNEVNMYEVSGFNSNTDVCSKLSRARIPYQGYRRDLVAIVGNASHQNRAVQDEVRKLGGLFLILQQCVVDEENPFLREWGLWAVRNLVDSNMENSTEISEMQMKGSLTPVELSQMGFKVEMDPVIGRPRLVNMSSVKD